MKKELKKQIKQDELDERPRAGLCLGDERTVTSCASAAWWSWCWPAPCSRSRTCATSAWPRRIARCATRSPPSRRRSPRSCRRAASARAARCSRARRRSTRPRPRPSRASSGATARPPPACARAYFGALSRIELGQYGEAEKSLKEIQARGAGLEPDLARLALAEVYRRSGQVDKAVEAYRSFASNPSVSLPRDQALLRAAQTLEDARRFAEARAAYRQLVEEFPASVFAARGPGARRVPVARGLRQANA